MKTKKNKTIYIGLVLLLIMAVFTACSEASSKSEEISGIIPLQTYEYKAEDLNGTWDKSDITTQITLADDNTKITGSGAAYKDGVLTISSEGTYLISGSLSNGQITIDAADSDTVRLVLNNVSITNKNAPALLEKNSDKTILTLADSSKNTLIDDSVYADTGSDAPNAALYATHDLSINGKGELSVSGNYNNAIGTQDDLVIVGSTIKVSAQNNGLKGRDMIAVKDANINVDSENNGLKSNNGDSASKGFIQIDSGSINITAKNDGIQAETNLIINGGDIDIKTTGIVSTEKTTTAQSMKAIKAVSQIAVNGGVLNLDSTDDAVHSNGNITVDGGFFIINTGDDGFHADGATVINDGTIVIESSYEGIEGATVEISGGKVDIDSSDDGINAAGGSDDEDTQAEETQTDYTDQNHGPMGDDQFTANDNNHIKIQGGELTIVANGDGLDSNGDLYIEGGTVRVSGPSNGAEGALDSNGEIYINGGDVAVTGNTSMPQSPSDDSKQNSIIIASDSNLSKGNTLYVKDSSGKTVIAHDPANDYTMVVLSSADLKDGETYSIYSGDSKLFDVTLSGTNTIVDGSGQATELSNMGGGGQPQPGQQGGEKPQGGQTPPSGQSQPSGQTPSNDTSGGNT